jgi:hypothetical protein
VPAGSKDMFEAGYRNLVNMDTSTVVITQQRKLYPQMTWDVENVMEMRYEGE